MRHSTDSLLGTAALAGLALCAACELPTRAPLWDTTWMVPTDSIVITTEALLPDDVVPDGAAFEFPLGTGRAARSLGQLCGAPCQANDGDTVPKPAFQAVFGLSAPLPERVRAAEIDDGRVVLEFRHTFDFDPLRPSSDAAFGSIAIGAYGEADEPLGEARLDGEARALPPDTPVTVTVPLGSGRVREALEMQIRLDSPEGDPAPIDVADSLAARVRDASVRARRIELDAGDIRLSVPPLRFAFGRIDAAILDWVRSGALLLTTSNPFELEGTLDLTFVALDRSMPRRVSIEHGDASIRAEFSGDEIRALLAADSVEVHVDGRLASPSGTVVVRADQRLVVRTRLELVIGRGGDDAT